MRRQWHRTLKRLSTGVTSEVRLRWVKGVYGGGEREKIKSEDKKGYFNNTFYYNIICHHGGDKLIVTT